MKICITWGLCKIHVKPYLISHKAYVFFFSSWKGLHVTVLTEQNTTYVFLYQCSYIIHKHLPLVCTPVVPVFSLSTSGVYKTSGREDQSHCGRYQRSVQEDPGRRQDPPLRAVLRRRGSTFTNGKTSFHKYTETKISGVIVSHRLTVTQAPGSGGFVGCVKDLKLNEALAGRPTHSQGTVPCFQQQLQPGAYFSGLGGHIAIGRFTVFHCPTDYLLVFLLLDSVVTVVWFIE